ncbi:MAG: ABC transporter ATP-binding protein [Chloroflexaceae bacterium]|jgi:NitT/TauT family transport system ATP-binding protein|nr:ABC transporter ATP-binding protein [Chloroflexaceae bacterium]
MSAPKVSIQNLSVTFASRGGPVEALAEASMHAADGELVCIVGPSGCGKTTMLRVLAGLQDATHGSAFIRDDGSKRPLKGMVFQGAGLFPWMTVAQNVAYGLQMQGLPQAQRQPIAEHWIGAIGLERFANAYPAQLSGGMQQRVGLARAFAYNPQVLLMDEPFGALDAQTRVLLQQVLLQQVEREARTVLFVTHSIEEALTIGDRVLVMSARPGRMLAEFAVPFARPRDAIALRGDPQFGALVSEIWAVLRGEVVGNA